MNEIKIIAQATVEKVRNAEHIDDVEVLIDKAVRKGYVLACIHIASAIRLGCKTKGMCKTCNGLHQEVKLKGELIKKGEG